MNNWPLIVIRTQSFCHEGRNFPGIHFAAWLCAACKVTCVRGSMAKHIEEETGKGVMVSGRGLKGKAMERGGGPKCSTHGHEAENGRNKKRPSLTKAECHKNQKQTKWDKKQSSNKTAKQSAKQKYKVQIKRQKQKHREREQEQTDLEADRIQ